MRNIIILSEKNWHNQFANVLNQSDLGYNFVMINSKDAFTLNLMDSLDPRYIFIPHWSYIIKNEIYSNFECVVFHMTDLPFGRGGSPLQNLISRGIKETKISALKVEKGIDTGPIYLKRPLNLSGTATDIFINAAKIILEMILEIVKKEPIPKIQVGESVIFKRRTSEMSDISKLKELERVYDFIRMLDCDGYPKAFIETNFFKLEFTKAQLSEQKEELVANVRIIKK